MIAKDVFSLLGLALLVATSIKQGHAEKTPPREATRTTTPCPRGSEYLDGCPGASAGIPQLPTLLTSYNYRPPWNVAGVDFAVGVPNKVVLKDPRNDPLPPGCSAVGHTVTCFGPVTLDAYDFSLQNGTTLFITGGDVTIQNCLFIVGSNQGPAGKIVDVSGAANVAFLHNEFDGSNLPVTPQQGQTINVRNSGTITFQYNYFHNSGGDMVDFSGGPQIEVVQYNLFKDVGLITPHSDTLQWCGSIISNSDLSFNTIFQSAAGLSGMGMIVPNSECSGAKMSGVSVHNNTLISKVRDNFAVGATVSQEAGAARADHIAVFNNYLDPTGIVTFTGSPWFPTGYYHSELPKPCALHSLIDMRTGSALPVANKLAPPSVFSATYYVYPDRVGYTPALSDVYAISTAPAAATLSEGASLTFVVEMDEHWQVEGEPTLSLNSGGVAHFAGSSNNELRFTYTVLKGQTASELAVRAISLNGGSIRDAFGNKADMTGVLATFKQIRIR